MSDDAPRQTLSYIKGLLSSRGIVPKNKLGQSFLIDLNLIELVVRTAELSRDDLALEIGTGTGSLTARLAELAGAVVSVELDPTIQQMASELLGDRANVFLLNADALRNKNDLNPAIFEVLTRTRDRLGPLRLKLVANLPYAVATPVICNLLLSDEPVERLVVTVQWEIAERLTAKVGTSAYGAMAVLVQSLADVEIVRRLAPAVFWPRPKVESAIVLIRPSADKRAHVGDVKRFRRFLRDLYVHRRKNLRGALVASPHGRRDKADVDAKLTALGLPGTVRAEDLDVEHHLRLCAVFGD